MQKYFSNALKTLKDNLGKKIGTDNKAELQSRIQDPANDFSGKLAKVVIDVSAQKMKFSIKDLFSKCDQIRRKLQI